MRVAALGRTRVLWNSIKKLHSEGLDIVLIATCRAAPEYDVHEDDFQQLATELGAEFLLTQDINQQEILQRLYACHAEIAISVNWISIIGAEACRAFSHGILNAHAGDLPRYRGNAPIAWAILQGEDQVGLTIHQMDPVELDAGPILVKDYFPLTERTCIGEVLRWIEDRTPDLFMRAVIGLERGVLFPVPQPVDPQLALRCYPRRPEDGLLDWNRQAEYLARLVRASSEPFAGAYTYFAGGTLRVWRTHAERWPSLSLAIPGQVVFRNVTGGEVGVASGDGVLVLEQVQLKNQERSRPTLVIKSLRDRLGIGVYGQLA